MTDAPPTPKPWACLTCEDALGYVEKCGTIRRLRLSAMISEAPVWITGDAVITCPNCGTPRTWQAGEDALEEYLQRWKALHR